MAARKSSASRAIRSALLDHRNGEIRVDFKDGTERRWSSEPAMQRLLEQARRQGRLLEINRKRF